MNTKTESLVANTSNFDEFVKASKERATKKEVIDFDSPLEFDAAPSSADDKTPLYYSMNLAQFKEMGIEATLPVNGIIPELRRMQKKLNRSLNGIVFNDSILQTNTDLLKEVIPDVVIHDAFDDSKLDFVFDASPIVSPEILAASWEHLATPGYLMGVNYNYDPNILVIKEFKKQNKISITTDVMSKFHSWSIKKEDYSDRIVHHTPASAPAIVFPAKTAIPSPEDSHLKTDYILKYAPKSRIFVETGTYLGQTVELMDRLDQFTEIHSIELNNKLYEDAKKKFEGIERIKLHHGDSVDVLQQILRNDHVNESVVFWLDAHASGNLGGGKSGGSPLYNELSIILDHATRTGVRDHVIFIDDRRLFGSAEWDGITLNDILPIIQMINPNYNMYALDGAVPGDVLCFTVH